VEPGRIADSAVLIYLKIKKNEKKIEEKDTK
jgi:hypothetical protein